jgi:prepilin signal peptidase PulO-like enzyme (type II secretory pathway)
MPRETSLAALFASWPQVLLAAAAGAAVVPLLNRIADRLPALLPAEPSAVIAGLLRCRNDVDPQAADTAKHRVRRRVLWIVVPLVSAVVGAQFADQGAIGWALLLLWGLAALGAVDAEAAVLPDVLTLPLTLAGLVANLDGRFCPLEASVLGAAGGYGLFVLCALAGRALGQRDPLGGGDQKAACMLGAWFGLAMLPYLVLGIVLASFVFLALARGRRRADRGLPLGPTIAVVGMAALLAGGRLPLL